MNVLFFNVGESETLASPIAKYAMYEIDRDATERLSKAVNGVLISKMYLLTKKLELEMVKSSIEDNLFVMKKTLQEDI